MAQIVNLFGGRRAAEADAAPRGLSEIVSGYSIEVMPRTAAKIESFKALLPAGTRVYVACIDGTPFSEMLATAERIAADGFEVMPHFPARLIKDRAELDAWAAAYADVGVTSALALAGGVSAPRGAFDNSMELLESGVFDARGFTRIHVAGHPEGNSDIDPDGGDRAVWEALRWKQAFSERTDAQMGLATQFLFDAPAAAAWTRRLAEEGVDLPVHLGVAGPAKLQTMIKFAIACGVGPSLRVLQRRAADITKLLLPFEPTEFLTELAASEARIAQLHFFPLGGIGKCVEWTRSALGEAESAAQPA